MRRYLVPLPPGLDAASPRLIGFFVYELRLGHDATRWSTAPARFGPPLRISGVQHPAPPLGCAATASPTPSLSARRSPRRCSTAAASGRTGRGPRPGRSSTRRWRSSTAARTAISSSHARAEPEVANTDQRYGDRRLEHASTRFDENTIKATLGALGLPLDSPLSVVAVEVYRGALLSDDPLGVDLGQVRVLRASPLTRVPRMCLPA